MMHKFRCKRCKHKFTKHDGHCLVPGCPCLGYMGHNSQQVIVTHETTEAVKAGQRTTTIYKSKRQIKKEVSTGTVLNPFLRFNFKTNNWRCIFCRGAGDWRMMRYHTHKKHLPQAFGIRLKKEMKVTEPRRNALIKRALKRAKKRPRKK